MFSPAWYFIRSYSHKPDRLGHWSSEWLSAVWKFTQQVKAGVWFHLYLSDSRSNDLPILNSYTVLAWSIHLPVKIAMSSLSPGAFIKSLLSIFYLHVFSHQLYFQHLKNRNEWVFHLYQSLHSHWQGSIEMINVVLGPGGGLFSELPKRHTHS